MYTLISGQIYQDVWRTPTVATRARRGRCSRRALTKPGQTQILQPYFSLVQNTKDQPTARRAATYLRGRGRSRSTNRRSYEIMTNFIRHRPSLKLSQYTGYIWDTAQFGRITTRNFTTPKNRTQTTTTTYC